MTVQLSERNVFNPCACSDYHFNSLLVVCNGIGITSLMRIVRKIVYKYFSCPSVIWAKSYVTVLQTSNLQFPNQNLEQMTT